MDTVARRVDEARDRRDDRRRTSVHCPYCERKWGPWTGLAIEPCLVCKRPLYLSAALYPKTHPNRVSSVLDTISALQGVFVMACFGLLVIGWMPPRQLGQSIAMAMFVAASGYATDGVLGLRSGIVRTFGQVATGARAQTAAIAKIAIGIVAFALSLLGDILFGGPAR